MDLVSHSRDYLQALRHYWEGRTQSALEHVTKMVADKPSGDEVFCFYRLWIELLAQSGDRSALREVVNHLTFFSGSDASPNYGCLKALALYELDDLEHATLTLHALPQRQNSPYRVEVTYLLAARSSIEFPKVSGFSKLGTSNDYFHNLLAARAHFHFGDFPSCHSVLKQICARYPESPDPVMFSVHESLDRGRYDAAADYAEDIYDHYPCNIDFGFTYAYALFEGERYEESAGVLMELNSLTEEKDPDILTLLGRSLACMSLSSEDKDLALTALGYLEKAEEILKLEGIPTTTIQKVVTMLRDAFELAPETDEKQRLPKAWMIKLSTDNFYTLKTADTSAIKSLTRNVGMDAAPGDVVFMVGDDYSSKVRSGSDSLRLGAVYSVRSEPFWHPIHRQQSVLRLVNRPEFSVPLTLDMADGVRVLGGGGVMELSSQLLQTISQTISEYADDEVGAVKNYLSSFHGKTAN